MNKLEHNTTRMTNYSPSPYSQNGKRRSLSSRAQSVDNLKQKLKSISVTSFKNSAKDPATASAHSTPGPSSSSSGRTSQDSQSPTAFHSDSSKLCLPIKRLDASSPGGLTRVAEEDGTNLEVRVASSSSNTVGVRSAVPDIRFRNRWALAMTRKALTSPRDKKKPYGSLGNANNLLSDSSSEISEASTIKAVQKVGDLSYAVSPEPRPTEYIDSLFSEPISSEDLQFSGSFTSSSPGTHSQQMGPASETTSNRTSQATTQSTTSGSNDSSFVKASPSSTSSRYGFFGFEKRARRNSKNQNILQGGNEFTAQPFPQTSEPGKYETATMLRPEVSDFHSTAQFLLTSKKDQALRAKVGLPPVPVLHRGPDATKHPLHPFAWNTKNLWCNSCTNWPSGTRPNQCDTCGAHCCVFIEAAEAMRSPDSSVQDKTRARERYNAIKKTHTFGKDLMRILLLCCDCAKNVCPGCCARCVDDRCGLVACFQCRPAGRKCEWHDLL